LEVAQHGGDFVAGEDEALGDLGVGDLVHVRRCRAASGAPSQGCEGCSPSASPLPDLGCCIVPSTRIWRLGRWGTFCTPCSGRRRSADSGVGEEATLLWGRGMEGEVGGDDIRGVIGVFIIGISGDDAGLPQRLGIATPLTHCGELKWPPTKREIVAYIDRLHA
jgi:hypothetical protein